MDSFSGTLQSSTTRLSVSTDSVKHGVSRIGVNLALRIPKLILISACDRAPIDTSQIATSMGTRYVGFFLLNQLPVIYTPNKTKASRSTMIYSIKAIGPSVYQ